MRKVKSERFCSFFFDLCGRFFALFYNTFLYSTILVILVAVVLCDDDDDDDVVFRSFSSPRLYHRFIIIIVLLFFSFSSIIIIIIRRRSGRSTSALFEFVQQRERGRVESVSDDWFVLVVDEETNHAT